MNDTVEVMLTKGEIVLTHNAVSEYIWYVEDKEDVRMLLSVLDKLDAANA